jgi:ligand-binding SRPBCC domain-containing protein
MPHRLQFADWVSFSLPHVFTFFANPENLPRLMPAAIQTRIEGCRLTPPPPNPDFNVIALHHLAGVGSVIDTSFRPVRFLTLRRKWTAAITEFEWNHHFADVQQIGPFKRWHHRHEFIADARNGFEGTLVRDVIEYEVGFGPLGEVADSLFIAHQMRQIFTERQKILPKLLAEK